MSEVLINYIIVFIFLELYEIAWQKSTTMLGMLARMYEYYKKSIFLFLINHPTFYFAIVFMLLTDYNGYAVALFAIKAMDIGMKIVLIKQIFIDKEVSHEVSMAIVAPLHKLMPYVGLAVYPPFIYLAMT